MTNQFRMKYPVRYQWVKYFEKVNKTLVFFLLKFYINSDIISKANNFAKKQLEKKMKKIFCLLLTVILSMSLFVACGKKKDDDLQTGSGPVVSEVKEIKGIVDEASTMNTLYLSETNGMIYAISLEGAEVESGGLETGDEITLRYVGELKDTDAVQSVEIKEITIVKAVKQETEKKEEKVDDSGADSEKPAGESKGLIGTIEDGTNSNVFFVSDSTGVIYQFSLAGVVVDSPSGGLNVGDSVEVFYTGAIAATDQLQTGVTISKVVVK